MESNRRSPCRLIFNFLFLPLSDSIPNSHLLNGRNAKKQTVGTKTLLLSLLSQVDWEIDCPWTFPPSGLIRIFFFIYFLLFYGINNDQGLCAKNKSYTK